MEIIDVYGSDDEIDFEKWFNSPYYPTPTIISAAIEAITHMILAKLHSLKLDKIILMNARA